MQKQTRLKDVISPEFDRAFSELYRQTLPAHIAFKLAETSETLKTIRTRFENVRAELLDRYAAKTEDGKLKTNEDGSQYVLEDKEAFDREYAALIESEVNVPSIKLKDIKNLQFTPASAAVLARSIVDT